MEDNPINLKLVEKIFSRYPQLKLMSAPSGTLGLEIAMSHPFDVIILDINLPGLNGFEVLQKLQENPDTKIIPTIALSANAMPADIEKGNKAGFFRYLTKPINIQNLVTAVQEAIADKTTKTQ